MQPHARCTHQFFGVHSLFNPFFYLKNEAARYTRVRSHVRSAKHFRASGLQLYENETGFSEEDSHRTDDSDGDDDIDNDDTKLDRRSLRGRATSRVKMTTISPAGTVAGGTRASKVAAARRGTQVRLRLSLSLSLSPACFFGSARDSETGQI